MIVLLDTSVTYIWTVVGILYETYTLADCLKCFGFCMKGHLSANRASSIYNQCLVCVLACSILLLRVSHVLFVYQGLCHITKE